MIKSLKPEKQRKFRTHAKIHERRKMMSSHLSKELRAKLKKRAVPVRKGDEVMVMRGAFSKIKGKVERVIRDQYKVYIDNVFNEKKNGTKVKIPVDASKLMITSLNMNDSKRFKGDNK